MRARLPWVPGMGPVSQHDSDAGERSPPRPRVPSGGRRQGSGWPVRIAGESTTRGKIPRANEQEKDGSNALCEKRRCCPSARAACGQENIYLSSTANLRVNMRKHTAAWGMGTLPEGKRCGHGEESLARSPRPAETRAGDGSGRR